MRGVFAIFDYMGFVTDGKYKHNFENTFWGQQRVMGQTYYAIAWVRKDGPKSNTTIGVRSIGECVLRCEMEISCRGCKSHSEGEMVICNMFLERIEFEV